MRNRIFDMLALAATGLLGMAMLVGTAFPAMADQDVSAGSMDAEVTKYFASDKAKRDVSEFLNAISSGSATRSAGTVADSDVELRNLQPEYALISTDADLTFKPVLKQWIAGAYIDGQPVGTHSMTEMDAGKYAPTTTDSVTVPPMLEQVEKNGGEFLTLESMQPFGYFMFKDGKVSALNTDSETYVAGSVQLDDFLQTLSKMAKEQNEAAAEQDEAVTGDGEGKLTGDITQYQKEFQAKPKSEAEKKAEEQAAARAATQITQPMSPTAIAVISIFGVAAVALIGFALFRTIANKRR